jgi:hypothetical protein
MQTNPTPSPNPTSQNSSTQQSINEYPNSSPTIGEEWMIGLTAAIVCMAVLQWLVFWRQKQIMNGQLKTMDKQLDEMKTTSLQLNQLVQQAAENAKAGQLAAEAADRSASALVNSESAWIMVSLERGKGLFVVLGNGSLGEQTSVRVILHCINQGKTPAWITEKRIRLKITTSLPPFRTLRIRKCFNKSQNPSEQVSRPS